MLVVRLNVIQPQHTHTHHLSGGKKKGKKSKGGDSGGKGADDNKFVEYLQNNSTLIEQLALKVCGQWEGGVGGIPCVDFGPHWCRGKSIAL